LKQVILRPAAAADLEDAYLWYERQSPGLGEALLEEADRSLRAIQEHPEAYPKIRREIRRRLFKRFPYCWLYCVIDDRILMVGCFHARRDPRVWRGRT
jgi:toxin ParE1/3/4